MERLQPYLPGFSIQEVPYPNSELLKAQKEYGDYYLYITAEGVKKATTKRPSTFDALSSYGPGISVPVETDEPTPEWLHIIPTRSSTVLWNGFSYDDIVVSRERDESQDEEDLLVYVYTPRLFQTLEGEQFMTRYDGHTNKLWLARDPADFNSSS